jgi:hypothetical protein
VRLPVFRGYSSSFLPFYAAGVGAQMERERPGLTIRGEGRANINKFEGYQLLYQVRERDGRRRYGRRIMLFPDNRARDGAELRLEADASAAVVNPDSVGQTGPLKSALRSFRLGTDVP